MSVAVEQRPGAVVSTQVGSKVQLSLRGDINDAEVQTELTDTVAQLIEAGNLNVLLDLSSVPALRSVTLELLLYLQDQLIPVGGSLRLANCRSVVAETLYATRLTEYLRLVDPPQELAALMKSEPRAHNARLGDLLVEAGVISQDKIDEAVVLQQSRGRRLGRLVIDKEWADEQDVLRIVALQAGLPFVRLRPGLYDPEIVAIVGRPIISRLQVVPVFRIRDTVFVATADPQHLPSLNELRDRLQTKVRPIVARERDIAEVIDSSAGAGELTTELVADVDDDFEVVEAVDISDPNTIDEMASGSPVINLVNSIIQKAVSDGASDVHIEAFRNVSRVRFRIDGVLYEISNQRADLHPAIVSRLKVMAGLDIAERRMPQDGRIQVNTQGRAVDLRFSSLPGLLGEKVVLRILDKRRAILDTKKLGMDAGNLQIFEGLLERSHGLILVTGPTGSGKTTSLYAGLAHLNSMERSIVTIEDPVEYQMEIINQNEVRSKIGLSFAKILKHVLRQDPDIVMVGEIRERETAEIAVQAALTGHLVLSTLHTNDSIGAVTRLMDMGVEPYLLSSAVIGVIAQRLIRSICPACRTSFTVAPQLASRYGWQDDGQIRLYKGRGCGECFDSGYKGRLAIHEALESDDKLQELIIGSPSRDELNLFMKENNIRTLFDDGLARVREGKTTLEEVTRVVNH